MAQLNDAPKKARFKAAILLLLTFAAGAVVGVAGDRLALDRQHRMVPRGGFHVPTERIAERLDRELDLTANQKAAVRTILERRRAAIEALWAPVQPDIRREIEQGNDEIAVLLTGEQREKFAEMREEWRKRASAVAGRPRH